MLIGKQPRWDDLAKDCVCFANASGGKILIGIEDNAEGPPKGQTIPKDLPEKILKRVGELTVNVTVAPAIIPTATGSEFIELQVARSHTPASTTDGRYYLRVADQCKPMTGDDIQRLLNERGAQPWETLTTLAVPREKIDPEQLAALASGIRDSDRVKPSVKEKSAPELMDHYYLAIGPHLTNLGILCAGRREDRARLGTAPVIQYIKYDADGNKVHKISWDDYSLSPMDLVETVWREVPDFREGYELPDGLFRQHIPMYDEKVVRELLVNALVHRPYTQRGDIYLNLHPDRMEIVNPGLLPLGVTPRNILHQSVRRNNELARIFHDLELMEREGSGFDLLYEVLLSQGRPLPILREGRDRVSVTVQRRILNPEVIDLIAKSDQMFQLRQREKITLGLLARHDALTARELAETLELSEVDAISQWMGRLLEMRIVRRTGRTKGTRYYIDPDVLRKMAFPSQTTLTRIEPHRLQALIVEDLRRHPRSSFGEIRDRIGTEIPQHQIRKQIKTLVEKGDIVHEGQNRWRRYSVPLNSI